MPVVRPFSIVSEGMLEPIRASKNYSNPVTFRHWRSAISAQRCCPAYRYSKDVDQSDLFHKVPLGLSAYTTLCGVPMKIGHLVAASSGQVGLSCRVGASGSAFAQQSKAAAVVLYIDPILKASDGMTERVSSLI